MNDPELDLMIKEKMQEYVPCRSIQVMHCGVIVLASIVIGVLYLPSGQTTTNPLQQGLGVLLAISGLALYLIWTHFRTAKARKEAEKKFLAASANKTR